MTHLLSIPRAISNLSLLIFILAVTLGLFTGGSWASLGIGGGILLFILVWAFERGHPPVNWHTLGNILTILAILALMATQANVPDVSWHMLLQEASIMIPLALLFSPRILAHMDQPRFFPVLCGAAAIGALAFALEFALGFPLLNMVRGAKADITDYNRGASYFAVFAFPLIGYMWAKAPRWKFALFVLIIALPIVLTESRATRLAFLVGIGICAAAHILPRLTRRSLIVILILLLAMPLAVTTIFLQHPDWVNGLPDSWHHRMEIWDYMSYRILERPWLGWGLGESHLLDYGQPHGTMYSFVKQPASHPHNAIIQLWVELGIGGALLGAACAIALLQKIKHFTSPAVPFALGAWAAGLCISLVSYSFWDDSLFSLYAMTMVACLLLTHQLKEARDGTV